MQSQVRILQEAIDSRVIDDFEGIEKCKLDSNSDKGLEP